MIKRPIYSAGDMLYKGSQLLRDEEARILREAGLPVYVPHEDKEINDKSNVTREQNDGLAEKIVRNDTIAIKKADTVIIEPQRFAEGTLVELGQIKAYNEMRACIEDILKENIADSKKIEKMNELIYDKIPHKNVYAHMEDIRCTDIEEKGFRRSFYVNQYVHGVILEVTNGTGFLTFEEIVEELKNKNRK